ncbi:MAG: hypothetical protein ABSE18_01635 [Minisyncoccia bacterium]
MLALVYLPAVSKEAAIEWIGENTGDSVPMVGIVGFGEETMLGEKRGYVLQAGIILGVEFKRSFNDFRCFPVHHDRFRARVVEVTDGGKRGKFATLHFFIEASFRVCGQVEDILVSDTKLYAHH